MKCGGVTRCLKAIARHHFQCMLPQPRAIGRKQDVAVSLCQFESVSQQLFEISFDLEFLSSGRTRKRWRIQNDSVKFLASAGQTRQHRSHIIRDEAMVDGGEIIQRKILASTRQRLLGKIDVESGSASACRTDRKRAGVRKAVEQSSRRDMAHVSAIFSLIQKKAWGIARLEIDPELQMSLRSDCLQIFPRVAKYEARRSTLFTFSRDEPCENASELKSDRARPRLQFCEESLAGQHPFERDEDVASETFHPAILHRAESVGVRSLCLKISKQRRINPRKIHFLLSSPTAYFESASRNGSVAG